MKNSIYKLVSIWEKYRVEFPKFQLSFYDNKGQYDNKRSQIFFGIKMMKE